MSRTKTDRLISIIERTECQRRIAERYTPERLGQLDASLADMRIELLKTRHKAVQKGTARK